MRLVRPARFLVQRLYLATTLSTKLFVPVAVLGVLITTVLVSLSYLALRREITGQYEQRARGAAALVEHELSETDLLANPVELTRHLHHLQDSYPEVFRATVYARRGQAYRVVASSEPGLAGLTAHPHDIVPVATGLAAVHEERTGDHSLLEVVYPLHQGGRIVATLGVYSSLTVRDQRLADLQRRAVVVAALALLVLLGLSYEVARLTVLGPLRSTLKRVEQVAAGNLEEVVGEIPANRPPQTVRNEVVRFTDAFYETARQLHQRGQQLRDLAIKDALTGLYNRRFFEEVVQHELARAMRYRQPFALAVIDIDGLRETNNRYGHLAGDALLKRTADFLRRYVRASDYIMRWGGDEFLILMPETDGVQALDMHRRLRASLAEQNAAAGETDRLSVSVGTAAWTPGRDLESMLQEADVRMYEEKQRGRGASRPAAEPPA